MHNLSNIDPSPFSILHVSPLTIYVLLREVYGTKLLIILRQQHSRTKQVDKVKKG